MTNSPDVPHSQDGAGTDPRDTETANETPIESALGTIADKMKENAKSAIAAESGNVNDPPEGVIYKNIAPFAVSQPLSSLRAATAHLKGQQYKKIGRRFYDLDRKNYASAQLQLWNDEETVSFDFGGKAVDGIAESSEKFSIFITGAKEIAAHETEVDNLLTVFSLKLAVSPQDPEFVIKLNEYREFFNYKNNDVARLAIKNAVNMLQHYNIGILYARDSKDRRKWIGTEYRQPLITGTIAEEFEKEHKKGEVLTSPDQLKGARRTGKIRIAKNMMLPWGEIARNYVFLSLALFDKTLKPIDRKIFVEIFTHASTSGGDILGKGTYSVSVKAIATRIGLPAIGDTRQPKRDIQNKILTGIAHTQKACDNRHGEGAIILKFHERRGITAGKRGAERIPGKPYSFEDAKKLPPEKFYDLMVKVELTGELRKTIIGYRTHVEKLRKTAKNKRGRDRQGQQEFPAQNLELLATPTKTETENPFA